MISKVILLYLIPMSTEKQILRCDEKYGLFLVIVTALSNFLVHKNKANSIRSFFLILY